MSESPSVLLQRAADRLSEMAEATTSGTWQARSLPGEEHMANVVVGTEATSFGSLFGSSCCGGHCYGHVNESGDATWITVMSPAVAAPLASMLRWDAKRLSWAARCEDVDKSYRGFELARQILGLPSKDEEQP